MTFAEHGYEIHVTETEIRFVDRGLWAPQLGFITLGVLAALMLLVGGGPLLADETLGTQVPAYVLMGIGVLLLIAVIQLMIVIRNRRATPTEQVANALIIDQRSQTVRTREGETITALSEVRVSSRLDLATRGWTRRVVLQWPGSKRTVYRSIRRKATRQVMETLEQVGISKG